MPVKAGDEGTFTPITVPFELPEKELVPISKEIAEVFQVDGTAVIDNFLPTLFQSKFVIPETEVPVDA